MLATRNHGRIVFINQIESVPAWLSRLSTKTSFQDQCKSIKEYIRTEPFEPAPNDLEKFHIGCYWIRYERNELSWATLLNMSGLYLDAICGDWDCETPYHYLNLTENAYFSKESEAITKKRISLIMTFDHG